MRFHTRINSLEKKIRTKFYFFLFFSDVTNCFELKTWCLAFAEWIMTFLLLKQSESCYITIENSFKWWQIELIWIHSQTTTTTVLSDITQGFDSEQRVESRIDWQNYNIYTFHALFTVFGCWTFSLYPKYTSKFPIQISLVLRIKSVCATMPSQTENFPLAWTSLNPFSLRSLLLILGWMNNNGSEQIWYHNMLCRLNHFFTHRAETTTTVMGQFVGS